MNEKKKMKQLDIRITFEDSEDLKQSLLSVHEMIMNGYQFNELMTFRSKRNFASTISYELEYLEKSDYIEKEIDGVWYQLFKSKMD
jgi:hypothetical protein